MARARSKKQTRKSRRWDSIKPQCVGGFRFSREWISLNRDAFGLDLGTASRPWLSLGHGQPVPDAPKGFGAPRFTPEQQAANPDKPMTRLVKDVIYPKTVRIGTDANGKPLLWNVTSQAIGLIQQQFKLAQSRGIAFNLTGSHGDLKTCTVPKDDLIAPIDDCIVENGRLWISTYVTPEVAVQLQNPAMKTSPGFKPGWVDGEGRQYPIQMYHVAVVDSPVVNGQGAFIALANTQAGGTSMDSAAVIDLFKRLLALLGYTLPDSVDETNAISVVEALTQSAEAEEGAEGGDEEQTEDPAPAGAGNTPPGIPADQTTMSNAQVPAWAKGLLDSVVALRNEMNADKAADRKSAFDARLQQLVAGGHVPAKSVVALQNAGQEAGYSLNVLAPFSDLAPMIPQGRHARTLANNQPPALPGGVKKMTPEEIVTEVIGKRQRKRTPLA